MNRVDPESTFWASRIILEGVGTHWLPLASNGNPTGSINLREIWSADEIASHNLFFVATVQYKMGRPYFNTEGRNADTEFDVWGHSRVDVSAKVVLEVTALPSPTPTPTPQPTDDAVFGFERDLQGFTSSGSLIDGLTVSPLHSFFGEKSMAIRMDLSKADSKPQQVFVENPPPVPPGGNVTLFIWLPSTTATGLSGVRPFLLSACGSYRYFGTYYTVERLRKDGWTRLVVNTSSDMPPISALGLEIFKSERGGAASSTLWLDSIRY